MVELVWKDVDDFSQLDHGENAIELLLRGRAERVEIVANLWGKRGIYINMYA